MKYLNLALLMVLSAVGSQAQTKATPANLKIYVDSATGFDTYLSEAAARNHVAITFTTQKGDADFAFDAISGGQTLPASEWSLLWSPGHGRAWIRLVNLADNGLVFACAVHQVGGASHGLQFAAESCAKHLRAEVNRSAHPAAGQVKAFLLGASQWDFR